MKSKEGLELEMLFKILKRYEIEKGQAMQVDVTTLLAHKYRGNLEEYLDGLDAKLSMLSKEPDQDFLLSLVEPELRKCKALEIDFSMYDRAEEGSRGLLVTTGN